MTTKYPMVISPTAFAPPAVYPSAPVPNTNFPGAAVPNLVVANVAVTNVAVPNVPVLNTPVLNVAVQGAAANLIPPGSSSAVAVAQIACHGHTDAVSPTQRPQVATLIINTVAAHCEQHLQKGVVVDTDTSFTQLQFDSLAMLEILYELEEELDITLDPSTLPAMTCVGDLLAAVNRARKSAP